MSNPMVSLARRRVLWEGAGHEWPERTLTEEDYESPCAVSPPTANEFGQRATWDHWQHAVVALADQISQSHLQFESLLTTIHHTFLPNAIIEDRSVAFESDEEKFKALVAEWQRLRQTGSSTAPLVNDAYGQIVAMGQTAIPFLLREMQLEGGHWSTALKWITGVSVVTPEMKGNVRAIRDAWIKWGQKHGHLDDR